MHTKQKIIIVTNSYKRDLHLVERSLEHSLNHKDKIQKVIFIDQNEFKLQISSGVACQEKLEHLHILTNCVSTARNSFEIPENTDWIIFCDDDGYLDDQYITKFNEIISNDNKLEIIAGSIKRDDTLDFYTPRHKLGGNLNNFRHTKLLMGSNFAVKAKTFKELGGFDELFGAGSYWGSGEETDFCWKAYFANIPMEYRPELIVYHIKPYAGSFRHSTSKAFRYGVGKGALVSKWLFNKKKIVVLFELAEMIIVPLAQALINLIKLKPHASIINISSIIGRVFGMLKYTFTDSNNKTM
jgi:hypothetical protein